MLGEFKKTFSMTPANNNSRNSWGSAPSYSFLTLLTLLTLLTSSCYSLRSTAIPPEIDTFYVETFGNRAENVVPTLAPLFTERLKDKIRTESRLNYVEVDPDITFSGYVTEYLVTPRVVQEGNDANFSDLKITILVNCESVSDEYEAWEQRFSFAVPFDNTQNLLAIQEELIGQVNDQLAEDIFNKAFNNW